MGGDRVRGVPRRPSRRKLLLMLLLSSAVGRGRRPTNPLTLTPTVSSSAYSTRPAVDHYPRGLHDPVVRTPNVRTKSLPVLLGGRMGGYYPLLVRLRADVSFVRSLVRAPRRASRTAAYVTGHRRRRLRAPTDVRGAATCPSARRPSRPITITAK